MKHFLPFAFLLFIFASCTQKSPETSDRNIELIVDSLVYKNNNIYTDTLKQEASVEPEVVTGTPVKTVATPRPVVKKQPVKKQPAIKTVPVEESVTPQPPLAKGPDMNESENAGVGTSGTVADVPGTVQTGQKKGMSKAAQGAVIGGASGAVAGAIISKKKGVGAVVGGVVGAAGGYIIGKKKDKKAEQ